MLIEDLERIYMFMASATSGETDEELEQYYDNLMDSLQQAIHYFKSSEHKKFSLFLPTVNVEMLCKYFLIAVRRDVVSKLELVADKQGIDVASLINEILTDYVKELS